MTKNTLQERWYDVLANGRPVYTVFAKSHNHALNLAKQIDTNTGKLCGKELTASMRISNGGES